MKDRFKFRFWHKPTEKMIDCYGYNKDFVFGDVLDGIGTTYNPTKFDDCILMQCIGLKDKNGKLIYEGDVVKFKNFDNKYGIGTIKYTDEDALFCLSYINENKRQDWEYVSRYRLEVLGNIYENPELLKENEDE